MKIYPECIPCHVSQASRISEIMNLEKEENFNFYRNICKMLSESPENLKPIDMAVMIYDFINKEYGITDVYSDIKVESNNMALKITKIIENDNSLNKKSLKFFCLCSAMGNLIDLGAHDVDLEKVEKEFISKTESSEFGIDNFEEFENRLKKGNRLLYILDNCGEAVFDKLFIKKIIEKYPHLKIIAAVRERPIINDITMKEAMEIGISELCDVMSSGSIYPGTDIERVNDEFRKEFESADVIVSKGQGNLEGLFEQRNKKKLFFCLTVKCKTIANLLGVSKGKLVFSNQLP